MSNERQPLMKSNTPAGVALSTYQSSANYADEEAPINGSMSTSGSTFLQAKPTTELTARKAFLERDPEASILFHKQKNDGNGQSLEKHGNMAGPHLKSVVYGGLDGIITTFATVTSVAGANLSPIVILIVGIAHLFADGISMGLGDALSAQAEIDYNNSERNREKWEMEVSMEQEIQEMIQLYVNRGLSREDAETIWRILGKYPQAFLDVMMVEELHLLPPDENEVPWKSGVVTCVAFMIFGAVPLLPFLMAQFPSLFSLTPEAQMNLAIVMTVVTLFLLGAFKATLVEHGQSWFMSGITVSGLGSLAAFISYAVGVVLQSSFDV